MKIKFPHTVMLPGLTKPIRLGPPESLNESEYDPNQLAFDFGPAPICTAMVTLGPNAPFCKPVKELASAIEDDDFEHTEYVLVQPMNAAEFPQPDDDGDYRLREFNIIYRFTMSDLFEAGKTNPDLSLDQFIELKAMETQMGLSTNQ